MFVRSHRTRYWQRARGTDDLTDGRRRTAFSLGGRTHGMISHLTRLILISSSLAAQRSIRPLLVDSAAAQQLSLVGVKSSTSGHAGRVKVPAGPQIANRLKLGAAAAGVKQRRRGDVEHDAAGVGAAGALGISGAAGISGVIIIMDVVSGVLTTSGAQRRRRRQRDARNLSRRTFEHEEEKEEEEDLREGDGEGEGRHLGDAEAEQLRGG